jgi:hypothetical protein
VPKHLTKLAARVWQEIVLSKPVDWFDPGSLILLENYCELAVQARAIVKSQQNLRRTGAGLRYAEELERRHTRITGTLTTLATKLRLSVQWLITRQSRKITEQGQQPRGAKRPDTLLGGQAVWGDRGKPH